MKKQDKSFEDFFRESFEGAEMTPSTHVWENISNRLDGKTRNKPFYWWAGGLAASIVLMFCAYILVYNPFGNNLKEVVVENTIVLNNGVENHEQIATQNSNSKINDNTNDKINDKINDNNKINNIVNNNKVTENVTNQSVANQNIATQNIKGENIANQNSKNTKNTIVNKNTNSIDLAPNNSTKNVEKSAKISAETTQNLDKASVVKSNVVKSSVVKSSLDKNLDKNSVATIAVPKDELPNNLNNDFHLLKRLSFREFPTTIKPLNVILFPLFNTTSKTDAPKVAVKIGTEIFIIGSYNSFSPNFSNVKDDARPYPFVTNDKNASMIYDSSRIAADLMNPTMISSYSFGFAINQVLYKGLGIRGGANYQATSYELQHKSLYFYSPRDAAQSPTKPVILQQKTALLTIPVSLSYQVQTGNFVCGLHAGVQTDILLQNSLTNNYYASGDHVYSFGTYNTLNFNGLAGIRFGYMITPHFSVNMEASYRKALNSVYDTPYLQSNPQNIGAGMSLGYRF